jgi:hydroxymethylglutaryl-CoA lyase
VLTESLPGEMVYGYLPEVGVEKGFRYAARGTVPEGAGKARPGAPSCQPAREAAE